MGRSILGWDVKTRSFQTNHLQVLLNFALRDHLVSSVGTATMAASL